MKVYVKLSLISALAISMAGSVYAMDKDMSIRFQKTDSGSRRVIYIEKTADYQEWYMLTINPKTNKEEYSVLMGDNNSMYPGGEVQKMKLNSYKSMLNTIYNSNRSKFDNDNKKIEELDVD